MRYLVTGGAGFIGAALTKRLLADGHDVTVLVHRSTRRLADVLPWPGHVVHGDIRDPEAVFSAAEGCDAVAHLAYPQGRGGDPRNTLDVAIRGMLNVLDACLKCDIPELLLVSSPDVYGNDPAPGLTRLTVPDELDPYCAYGGGKIASEMLAIAWERWGSLGKLIIARPHNVFGPDMGTEHVIPQLIKQIMNHPDDHLELPLQGGGMTTRSFCYITDCVDQLITMLDQGDSPGIYNVGSGEGVLIGVVATAIAGYLGRTVHIVNGPPPQGPYRRVPDMDKTLALCGYGPRVSLSEGLERTVDSYKNHG